MFLFTQQEAVKLRAKAKRQPYIFSLLRDNEDYPAECNPIVPAVSRGNWEMYYHCPKDSAPLTFDWQQPHRHICPVCGATYSGDPYDGAWESALHNRNADAALRFAYLHLLSQKTEYAAAAIRILIRYAACYPQYIVHGDIPYNGPGLAFAQTLDEAVFFRKIGYAYDLVSDILSAEDKTYIEENFLRIGAEFLLTHRTKQVHNHEVLINSSIGILGLLLHDKELLQQGVYGPFGLNDQRRQGTLADDFWFEGSFSYHEYALSAFFAYEIFARHTAYSNLADKQYLRMLKKGKDLLMEDDTVPALNDSRCLGEKFSANMYLEFGYKYYRDEQLLSLLHIGYQGKLRQSIDTFFYGVETLPPASPLQKETYHDEHGSGLTILRGTGLRYLLVKHSPFGGEHDHYDRLGISFSAFGDQMCCDLGTVAYGAPWHYDYYKNTGTHNTVMVEEENQPPQRCRVLNYRQNANSTFLDCSVCWDSSYQMPLSFIIKQWNDEVYQGTCYRRRILWRENYFVDVVTVSHPKPRCTDWILHIDGKREFVPVGQRTEPFSNKKPFCYLSDARKISQKEVDAHTWKTPHGYLRLFSFGTDLDMYLAKGLNLPPNREIDYVIQRQTSKECLFVNIFETYQEKLWIEQVEIQRTDDLLHVTVNGTDEVFGLREEQE